MRSINTEQSITDKVYNLRKTLNKHFVVHFECISYHARNKDPVYCFYFNNSNIKYYIEVYKGRVYSFNIDEIDKLKYKYDIVFFVSKIIPVKHLTLSADQLSILLENRLND